MKSLKIRGVVAFSLFVIGVVKGDQVDKLQIDTRNVTDIGFHLESPKVTDFGSWGEPEECSSGNVVTSFQLKVEPKHSIDDTGLNGIRFFCGRQNPDQENITSKVGPFGNWGQRLNCSTYAVGFELQSQEYQGARGDDTAATNLKIFCADGTSIEGFHDNGHTFKGSRYTGPQMCNFGKGLCGLQTQVERYQVFGDDTSLNNLRVKCCSVVDGPAISQQIPNVPVLGVSSSTSGPDVPILGVSSTAAPVAAES